MSGGRAWQQILKSAKTIPRDPGGRELKDVLHWNNMGGTKIRWVEFAETAKQPGCWASNSINRIGDHPLRLKLEARHALMLLQCSAVVKTFFTIELVVAGTF